MINIGQLDGYVIKPTLEYLGMNSLAARQLMVGTAITESSLSFIHQIGGPALGLFQVEPTTYDDNYMNYLNYRPELKEKVLKLSNNMPCGAAQMVGNIYYNLAHARLKYWRSHESLPEANDYEAMANYHKKVYNTIEGATDVFASVSHFKTVCEKIKE